jgi:A/G-specific adenine glycosylase
MVTVKSRLPSSGKVRSIPSPATRHGRPPLEHGRSGTAETQIFGRRLLAWYDQHQRDLPWRKDRDPYRVWLSEIMLQQTRVAAVLEHYRRFLKKFPTVQRLASARESSVLAAWSGLGYYRRARMLHAAARVIVSANKGRFPDSREGLAKLPGVGRYTSAAIASIAFGEPVAVVDGNVDRVLQRFEGKALRNEEVWRIAQGLLDTRRPGDFNQAMMELGATICLPRQPRCLLCPVASLCALRGELPAAKPAPRQRTRTIRLGLANRSGEIFLLRRSKHESLMPGMWELPEFSSTDEDANLLLSLRHSITVTNYTVFVFALSEVDHSMGKWVPMSRLTSLPLTGLARKILRRTKVM